jgi:hypothetical protein
MFKNRAVRRKFGSEWAEVTGWRKLYNENHNLYSLNTVIRMMLSRGGEIGTTWVHKCIQSFGRET